jgi:phage protein D
LGRERAVPRLCKLYPDLCLTTEEKHGKTSVRVAKECQLAGWKQNIQNRTYATIRINKHNDKNT